MDELYDDIKVKENLKNTKFKEGYMLKKSPSKGKYKKKYFVQLGINLMYYNSKEDYESEKEEVRSIATFQSVITRWPVSDKEFCMELKVKESIFYIHAESAEDRMSWINEIRRSSRIHIEGYKLKSLKFEVAKVNIMNTKELKTSYNKKKKQITGSFKKTGTLYRKGLKATKPYNVVLKNKSLKIYVADSDKLYKDFDLLLVEPIDEESVQQVESSIGAESLYFFSLVNTEAGRTELLGSADIEDLQDWIYRINKLIKRRARKKKGKN